MTDRDTAAYAARPPTNVNLPTQEVAKLARASAASDELIVLANLSAGRGERGGLVLTQKYLNGVSEFARLWPGHVTTLVRIGTQRSSDMDHVEVFPRDLPFGVEVRPDDDQTLAQRLSQAVVVLAFLSPGEAHIAAWCRRIGVPLVYYSEYSPHTEAQIIDAETANPLLRWRRKRWARWAEGQRLAALRLAAGVQCSGAPTFEIYRHVSPDAMIFFDNRVRDCEVVDAVALQAKAAATLADGPLRLVFGGRLVAMKGVMDLPLVALALRRRRVPFMLDIYGDGAQRAALSEQILRHGLANCVRLCGVLDFQRGWIPLLKTQVDLFVCCHPQGDPSSTYPEVMACGVPIVGYDNEAFAGIVRHSGCGWASPVGDFEALAAVIDRLAGDREALVEVARRSSDFARRHVFERTFSRRTAQLLRLSRMPEAAKQDAAAALEAAAGPAVVVVPR